MKLDCWPDFVTLVWTESRSEADTSLFRLGNCFPSSLTAEEAVFNVYFSDCNFRRLVSSRMMSTSSKPFWKTNAFCLTQVSGDHLMYTNDLTYVSSPGSDIEPFSQLVICSYKRWMFTLLTAFEFTISCCFSPSVLFPAGPKAGTLWLMNRCLTLTVKESWLSVFPSWMVGVEVKPHR